MDKQQFKQFVKYTSGGIRWIENNIYGRKEYDYETDRMVFVPYTDSKIWSKWMVGVEHRYNGCIVYMWFRIFNHEKMTFHLNHVWHPGSGKKMRRDAAWNLEYKIGQKAGIY